MDKRTLLKIRGLTLAQESRIIRRMQKKRPAHAEEMHNHRVAVVRPAARAAHLAYGFLRGRTKGDMEPFCRTKPNFGVVSRLVRSYGIFWPWRPQDDPDGYAEYLQNKKRQEVALSIFLGEWE